MLAAPFMLEARQLTVGAGGRVIQQNLNFAVRTGEVLAIVGPSGCGKSTLLRHLFGLEVPLHGEVLTQGRDVHRGSGEALAALRRTFGVMFQAGALWSSLNLGQNLMLPMRLFTVLPTQERERRARFKLALVGLEGCFDLMPAQLSGGMRKRAALARAMALDPPLLFLDEPGSGLDPLNAAHVDELVLRMRDDLGTTVVLVTHDVPSVMAVADRMLYLDEQEQTMTALAPPAELLRHGPARVQAFLRRGVPA
jgi:phospholipid/cholesterol/gamma-HCH transport system ATP-binding protein